MQGKKEKGGNGENKAKRTEECKNAAQDNDMAKRCGIEEMKPMREDRNRRESRDGISESEFESPEGRHEIMT